MNGGYVYLLHESGDDSLYKIGVTRSKDVDKRIKKLQTGNGNKIEKVYQFYSDKPFKLEKLLHLEYNASREEGEWFLMSKEEVDNFLNRCLFHQGIIDSLKDNPFF